MAVDQPRVLLAGEEIQPDSKTRRNPWIARAEGLRKSAATPYSDYGVTHAFPTRIVAWLDKGFSGNGPVRAAARDRATQDDA